MRIISFPLCFLLCYLGLVLADDAKSIFIINDTVDKIRSKSTLSRADVYKIEYEVVKYGNFIYGYQIVAYLWAGLHDYQRSYRFYNQALTRIPVGSAILFYDNNCSIFVKKEDILFNMALVSYSLANTEFADTCINEAVTIANSAHRKATNKENIISPRARVYENAKASRGVEYNMIQPCFEKIQNPNTLRGVPSEIPWTINDDYESGDPLMTAPIQRVRQDSVGVYNFADQRFPRRIKMSSVHLIPRAED